jgi:tartrate dehydrogenase/decarboxylase / D-malate dehydrogenase
MSDRFSIAVIPGDGIGTETTAAALRVVDAALEGTNVSLEWTELPWGSAHYRRTGNMIPPDGVESLKEFDAILFGASGSPDIPDHISLWGLRLAICQGLDQYISLRPTRRYVGVESPLRSDDPFDFVIVRENTEGEYAGVGGRVHSGLESEVAVQTAVFTRAGVERVVDYAFELARARRKHLTSITKSNAQAHGMGLWDEVVAARAAKHPDVTVRTLLVDAAAARIVLAPGEFDVVVASNLLGDILSDLGGALTGSLGMAASANLDPTRRNPSMFEPVHGSAADIVGRGIANPIGSIGSAAMMLDHLGLTEIAVAVRGATDAALAEGVRTPDIGGDCTTDDVTSAITAKLGTGTRIPASPITGG